METATWLVCRGTQPQGVNLKSIDSQTLNDKQGGFMGQFIEVHHLSLAHIGCKSVYMIQTATKSLTLSKHVTGKWQGHVEWEAIWLLCLVWFVCHIGLLCNVVKNREGCVNVLLSFNFSQGWQMIRFREFGGQLLHQSDEPDEKWL